MVLDATTKDRLKQQIEFYFSDSNLPRDKFLQEQVASNEEGYVDIALLCIFSRVRSLLSSTIADASAVAESTVADVADALEAAESLSLSEDRKRVKRAAPLKAAQEVTKELDERSLYASPFPYDSSLDAITSFFQQHAPVKSVRMRRHLTSKDFKGSVFVEFAAKEEAEKVQGMELVFEGAPLKMEAKLDYVQRKEEERHARPNSPVGTAGKKRRAEGEPEAGEKGAEGGAEGGEEEAAAAAAGGEEAPAPAPQYEPGCVLHFDFGAEVEFTEAPTFGLVKDSFGGRYDGGVKYVDYNQGDKSGYVRFNEPSQAAAAAGKAEEGKLMVAGYSAAVKVLEGEEELAFMVKSDAARRAATDKREKEGGGGRGGRGGGRGRGGRGRGGRGGGRGRGGRGGGKRSRTD